MVKRWCPGIGCERWNSVFFQESYWEIWEANASSLVVVVESGNTRYPEFEPYWKSQDASQNSKLLNTSCLRNLEFAVFHVWTTLPQESLWGRVARHGKHFLWINITSSERIFLSLLNSIPLLPCLIYLHFTTSRLLFLFVNCRPPARKRRGEGYLTLSFTII